jgi:PhnB protein
VCPRLLVDDADAAIAVNVEVFGATERGDRLRAPDGQVLHSELTIGDSLIMVSADAPNLGAVAPDASGTTTVMLQLYGEAVDGVTAWAEAAGAGVLRVPHDECSGDRTATIADPFGHRRGIASHAEAGDADDMARRVSELMRPASA